MKKLMTFILVLCMALSFAGCGFNYENPEEVKEQFDEWAGRIGQSQITEEDDLIGERINGEDKYVGTYTADCDDKTGRDVIFGGASITEHKVKVHGIVKTESGKATVRIRNNWDVVELTPNVDGLFETNLNLTSGGNYIMVDYENFVGTIDLYSEYVSPESKT